MATLPTRAQVNDAMDAVNSALADDTISDSLKGALNELFNNLQSVEDTIIESTEADAVAKLTANNDELQALTDKVRAMAASLDSVAATIQKISSTVGTIVSVVGALI